MSIRTGCIRIGGERVMEGSVSVVVWVANTTRQVLVHQSAAGRVVAVHQHHGCRAQKIRKMSMYVSKVRTLSVSCFLGLD